MSDANWVVAMLHTIVNDGEGWTEKLCKDKRIPDCKVEAIRHSFWAVHLHLQEIEKIIKPRYNDDR